MAGKVGCALLLAVLFAAAAVSRTSFAVFLVSLAVLLVGFLAWYVRTLRRDVTVTLQLPARPVHPDEDFAVLVKLHNNGRRPCRSCVSFCRLWTPKAERPLNCPAARCWPRISVPICA